MGIRPWEHDLMTVAEMDRAIAECDLYIKRRNAGDEEA